MTVTYASHPDSLRHCGWEWHGSDGSVVIVTDEDSEWLIGFYPDGLETDESDTAYTYVPTEGAAERLLWDRYGITVDFGEAL